jgi:hypothetical protein
MTSKVDQLDLRKGVKDVLKNVGKNLGKIQDIKNTDSKLDQSKSSFAGIVWEKDQNLNHNNLTNSNSSTSIDTFTSEASDSKASDVKEFKIDVLERTTVFSNKVSMWIS